MKQILENNDISVYANPKFDNWQMYEIREGLRRGLDMSFYANPDFDHLKMEQMRLHLKNALDGKE